MNDQEYIREGVELADGFQLTNDGRYFSMPHGGYVPVIDGCQQQYRDALAAQLVRQINKLGPFPYVTIAPRATVVRQHPEVEYGKELGRAEGLDQTMNTIKAIVDSGVLK